MEYICFFHSLGYSKEREDDDRGGDDLGIGTSPSTLECEDLPEKAGAIVGDSGDGDALSLVDAFFWQALSTVLLGASLGFFVSFTDDAGDSTLPYEAVDGSSSSRGRLSSSFVSSSEECFGWGSSWGAFLSSSHDTIDRTASLATSVEYKKHNICRMYLIKPIDHINFPIYFHIYIHVHTYL